METMSSRERLLTALNNQRPDRLPCQVHAWMDHYLQKTLNGMDWYQANEYFGFDQAIYVSPAYQFHPKTWDDWRVRRIDLGPDADGNHRWEEYIETPKGTLHHAGIYNDITPWETEYLLKSVEDFEIWNEFSPVPCGANFENIAFARRKLGDKGIVRSHPFYAGQGSPWQCFCTLFDTADAIMLGMDEPSTLRHILEAILQKSLAAAKFWAGTPADMIEVGGGAGSSTVISPEFYRNFGLPYDQRQNQLFQELGLKVVNHFCGGLMPMLDLVVESGADGLETMTPPAMGGDCDLSEASRRVGDKLFFIGGFDQNAGFERGTPEKARALVFDCFEATKDHAGYIIAPSDHFFTGAPENLKAFVEACKTCVY